MNRLKQAMAIIFTVILTAVMLSAAAEAADPAVVRVGEVVYSLSVAQFAVDPYADIAEAGGEELTEENITTKRPGNGIDPMKWPEVLGTKAIRDFEEDELIEI